MDWIYIDGIHEYDDALADLGLAAQKCKPNAIICGDDYGVLFGNQTEPEVSRTAADFLSANPHRELKWVKKNQFFIGPR